jgi:glycosyltransferase involved in cell wall biosynthesis
MKVAFIARSTLFTVKGGDTIQIQQTAKHLEEFDVYADIRLAHEKINYKDYDLLHFFNLTRPSDILQHIQSCNKPFAVTPILINYSEYDKQYRKGITGHLFRFLSADQIEYIKTIGRWAKGQQEIKNRSYIFHGQQSSIKKIIKKASIFLPNSEMEYQEIVRSYSLTPEYCIIPNGIDEKLFQQSVNVEKDNNMILSVARIEGIKNQLNLIKAINNSKYQLYIIGSASVNQPSYYHQCRESAAENIHFIDHLSQEKLIPYYRKAKVHVLPSWFETCGLSTLEAVAMQCNVVITDKGFTYEYFSDNAFYCDPSSPSSILKAIENASKAKPGKIFQQKIFTDYTWRNAAIKTHNAYKKLFSEL